MKALYKSIQSRHSSAGRNPRDESRAVNDNPILQTPDCVAYPVVIPAKREWMT